MSKNPERVWLFECEVNLHTSGIECEKTTTMNVGTRKDAIRLLKLHSGWNQVEWPNKAKKAKVWCCGACLEVKEDDPDQWDYEARMEWKYYVKEVK